MLIAAIVIAALGVAAFGPALLAAARRPRAAQRRRIAPRYDPGQELRAERRAQELLRSVVSAADFDLYRELGFLSVPGAGGRRGYAYLIYPHRPVVAYDTETGELLNEYCVAFPETATEDGATRLPDSDDVLAKWMSLHGDERGLIKAANMHVPGRQVDPGQVRRDLVRLREWRARQRRAA